MKRTPSSMNSRRKLKLVLMASHKIINFCLPELCQPIQVVLYLLMRQSFGSPSVATASAARDLSMAANAVLEESTLALPLLAWMMFSSSKSAPIWPLVLCWLPPQLPPVVLLTRLRAPEVKVRCVLLRLFLFLVEIPANLSHLPVDADSVLLVASSIPLPVGRVLEGVTVLLPPRVLVESHNACFLPEAIASMVRDADFHTIKAILVCLKYVVVNLPCLKI
jgi:hypothetical protein